MNSHDAAFVFTKGKKSNKNPEFCLAILAVLSQAASAHSPRYLYDLRHLRLCLLDQQLVFLVHAFTI